MGNDLKRIIIIAVYFFIAVIVIGLLYFWLKPSDPTCFDGKQNQNEQGVDCGGSCEKACPLAAQQSLAVSEAGFVSSGVAGSYDLYAIVDNPNQTLGSGDFSYQFTVKNSSGAVIAVKGGTNFILPGETKYVTENNIPLQELPAEAELSTGATEWVEANEFYEKPQLKVVYKNYNEITSGVGFSEATGLLKNESPLSFTSVKLEVILKDSQGEIIALNSTVMSTVQSGESRDFRVFWPNRFSGSVANMEVQAQTNIFSYDAYVKKYFQPQKFQQR